VLKENKLHYRLEIWSKRLKTDKMAYYVVHESSSYLMKKNKVEGLNRVLNTTAVPIVSGGFRDRWFPDVLLSIKKN